MALTKTQADGINLGDTFTYTGTLQVQSEGGAVNTSIQQGVAKNWTNYNQSSGLTVSDSFNTSSMTDNSTGEAFINFSNNMSNSNYAKQCTGMVLDADSHPKLLVTEEFASSTSIHKVQCRHNNDGAKRDEGDLSTTLFGDLA